MHASIRPGTRVYVLDDDCDEHIEIRITPGVVRKVIVETEADTDGGVSDLVSYEIEPEGSPKTRTRRLFCDVIEHEPTDTETRLAIGRAILLRIARMRPAPVTPTPATDSVLASPDASDIPF